MELKNFDEDLLLIDNVPKAIFKFNNAWNQIEDKVYITLSRMRYGFRVKEV